MKFYNQIDINIFINENKAVLDKITKIFTEDVDLLFEPVDPRVYPGTVGMNKKQMELTELRGEIWESWKKVKKYEFYTKDLKLVDTLRFIAAPGYRNKDGSTPKCTGSTKNYIFTNFNSDIVHIMYDDGSVCELTMDNGQWYITFGTLRIKKVDSLIENNTPWLNISRFSQIWECFDGFMCHNKWVFDKKKCEELEHFFFRLSKGGL